MTTARFLVHEENRTPLDADSPAYTLADEMVFASAFDELQGQIKEAAEALRGMQKVVDMLMPGAAKIAIQDYQLLNEAPVNAANLLQKLEA